MNSPERGRPQAPLSIAGEEVPAGARHLIRLPAPRQLGLDDVTMAVHVCHGRVDGPTLFVTAGVHGDEVNGVEVVRRLLTRRVLAELRGTLLAVPVVNIHGFVSRSRYLPDRRDLNRSFPGREAGSLAARLAHLVATQIIARSTHGVDLHTGAVHRTNLPHLRGDFDDERVLAMGAAFGAPLMLHTTAPGGTLLDVARAHDIPVLVFEGGEALRFDEASIRTAERGVLAVMRGLGMLPRARKRKRERAALVARQSRWVRAPHSGMLSMRVELGAVVSEGQVVARIADPFVGTLLDVRAPRDGVVIGRLVLPLVNEGDAIIHVAQIGGDTDGAADFLDDYFADPSLSETS